MNPAAAELARRLGLDFTDLALLRQALIHSSYVNEHPAAGDSNERLEFLGDAVVSLILSEELWRRHPAEDEGSLTVRRAAIVAAPGLAGIADRLELGSYLLLGQGARQAGERSRRSVLAGVFEAVTGAIYLEFGLAETRRWLLKVVAPELDAGRAVASLKAPKSVLQELCFSRGEGAPRYRVVNQAGPAHDRRYVVEVAVGGVALGSGEGRSRRAAETAAAKVALAALDAASPVPVE